MKKKRGSMSNPQAESVIRNIIQEICAQCSSRGQTVSETLAAFIVRWLIDAFNGLTLSLSLGKGSSTGP